MHQNMWNVYGKCFKMSTQRFCIGTNEAHSVKEFVEEAFTYMDWNEYVKIDPKYFRLTEAEILVADPANVIKKLG